MLATAYLVWVLRDFHVVKALREIANVNWKWVLLAMALDILSYGVQALRWKLLLTPFGKVRLTRSIRAVFAGLFANLIFPLRPGEVLRSYLLSTSEGFTLGRVLGSVGVERLVDLVIATASLGIVSLFVQLPQRFNRMADILGAVTLVVVGIVVLLILYLELKLGDNPPEETEGRGLSGKAMAALTALHAMGTAPSFYPALLTSVFMPLCQAGALWMMMRSYGLQLAFSGSRRRSACDQPGRFASECPRECWLLPILLRPWPQRVSGGKVHRDGLFDLRVSRAQLALRDPGFRGSFAQRPFAAVHAREGGGHPG